MGIGPGAAERKIPGGWCQDRIIDLILKVSRKWEQWTSE